MNNNNGTDVFGLDNNLEGRINEGWWRIVDGKMIKDTRKMYFECTRKEVANGGGDIKEGEYLLSGRGIFIRFREVRKVGD